MTRRFALGTTAMMLVAVLAGCGRSAPGAMLAHARVARVAHVRAVGDVGATEAAFIAAVLAQGVTLTPDELAELQVERATVPNDTWAPRPAMNLTAAQNLTVHFLKHGAEFNPPLPTEDAYMAQGNAAGTGGRGAVQFLFDTTSYAKGYQTHVCRWVSTTLDFTAFKTDGTETTYYRTVPATNRFIPLPIW